MLMLHAIPVKYRNANLPRERGNAEETYSSPTAPLGLLSCPLWGIGRVLHTHRLTTICSSVFFLSSHWHP